MNILNQLVMTKVLLVISFFIAITSPSVHADIGKGCINSSGYICTDKPGLQEGQLYEFQKDFIIYENWTYFVDGLDVKFQDLIKYNGQSGCMMTIATNSQNKPMLPSGLQQADGSIKVPKNISPYQLDNISWYVETVFLKGATNNGTLGLAIVCGDVEAGELKVKPGTTSQANLLRHLPSINLR